MSETVFVPAIERVKFDGGALDALRKDGIGWVCVKPLCSVLGLDVRSQQRRITRAPWAEKVTLDFAGADGKTYKMFCLRADKVAMWLATIDTARVKDAAAKKTIIAYQCNAAEALDKWVRRGMPAWQREPAADVGFAGLQLPADVMKTLREWDALFEDGATP